MKKRNLIYVTIRVKNGVFIKFEFDSLYFLCTFVHN